MKSFSHTFVHLPDGKSRYQLVRQLRLQACQVFHTVASKKITLMHIHYPFLWAIKTTKLAILGMRTSQAFKRVDMLPLMHFICPIRLVILPILG